MTECSLQRCVLLKHVTIQEGYTICLCVPEGLIPKPVTLASVQTSFFLLSTAACIPITYRLPFSKATYTAAEEVVGRADYSHPPLKL